MFLRLELIPAPYAYEVAAPHGNRNRRQSAHRKAVWFNKLKKHHFQTEEK